MFQAPTALFLLFPYVYLFQGRPGLNGLRGVKGERGEALNVSSYILQLIEINPVEVLSGLVSINFFEIMTGLKS